MVSVDIRSKLQTFVGEGQVEGHLSIRTVLSPVFEHLTFHFQKSYKYDKIDVQSIEDEKFYLYMSTLDNPISIQRVDPALGQMCCFQCFLNI